MMRMSTRSLAALALVGLAACGDALAVENLSSPDVARVLSSAASVEAAVAGFGAQMNNPQRAVESVNTQAKILADETFATVANFGMAARVANRSLVDNDLGNDNQTGNIANFNSFQRLARLVANTLKAYNNLRDQGKPLLAAADEYRMRAFAYFILGRALTNTAIMYDSGAVVTEQIGPNDIPDLIGAAQMQAAAIVAFDSAVAIASRTTPAVMSAIPVTWLSQAGLTTPADFVRLIRTYRARARAAVARTPAERAAVDWPAVIADAAAGITADHVITINGTTGWNASFDANQIYFTGGWHSLPMKFLAMADSSGAYQAWVASASSVRRAFLVRTLDARWPTGDTRALQQASTPNNIIAPRYIRNRDSGNDILGAGDGESNYDHRRFGFTQSNTTNAGPYTELSKTEIDMLAAEGYLRVNNYAAAEPLINISRLRNGLPSVVGVGAGLVPGGAACVPKLPNGTCGTLYEAMKYEKRMETAFTGYAVWYSDARGWGDIAANSVIEWPVPYQEMQARLKPFYDGTRRFAGPSTYGF